MDNTTRVTITTTPSKCLYSACMIFTSAPLLHMHARYRNIFMALVTMSMFEMGGANFPEAQESAIQVNYH